MHSGWPPSSRSAGVSQLTGLSAKAGRRITTVTIETSDPVAYLTNRPDPMTLVIDLREVDAVRAARHDSRREGHRRRRVSRAGTGADGVRVARVRIRLTQPAAHQVRSNRNVISRRSRQRVSARQRRRGEAPPSSRLREDRFATCSRAVRAEAKPTGASITLTGNGELVAESVTPFGDGTPRVVLDFPNVRSQVPADVFVGRGPVSVVHVTTTGAVPTTRVVVDLLRPASYRVIPPEDGEREFTILFEETSRLRRLHPRRRRRLCRIARSDQRAA